MLADVRIMQCQLDALEICFAARAESKDAVDAEEREKMNAFILKVVTRMRSKSHNLYMALRPSK